MNKTLIKNFFIFSFYLDNGNLEGEFYVKPYKWLYKILCMCTIRLEIGEESASRDSLMDLLR